MDVIFGTTQIIVDDKTDIRYINSPGGNISTNQDPTLFTLKILQSPNSLALSQIPMQTINIKLQLSQSKKQSLHTKTSFPKNNNTIFFKFINQIN